MKLGAAGTEAAVTGGTVFYLEAPAPLMDFRSCLKALSRPRWRITLGAGRTAELALTTCNQPFLVPLPSHDLHGSQFTLSDIGSRPVPLHVGQTFIAA